MAYVKASELRRRHELDGAAKTYEHLKEALEQRHLKPDDFSLRDLAEQFCGPRWVKALDPREGGVELLEADGDGVDVTAFRNITGQIVYSKVMEGYRNEAFVASRLVDTISTRFDGEKIPGVSKLGDFAKEVAPGMPYPTYGFGEDYIETPSTSKRGFIVPVTREAIFFDRTNLVLARAAEVGESLGLNKEKRLLDVIIGVTNTFKWNGTAYDTYQAATPWINTVGSNELVDWTDVDAAEQLFANMLDPRTSEPILITGLTVMVSPAYRHAAHRIFEAAEIRYTSGSTETLADNPLAEQYRVEVSRLMYRRIVASGQSEANAKKWWFVGDFKKAFAYMENWPITVTQAPANSEAEFTHDIVVRYKASERGTPAVLDPRYMIKNTG
jgi:hypothetical protein